MLFWIIAATMIALALAIVVWPLIRKPEAEADRRREQNIVIAREQLAELEAEFNAGLIEQDTYEQSRKELELSLHDSLTAIGGTELKANPRRPWFGLTIVGVFVPVFSLGMYAILGSPELADPANVRAQDAVAKVRSGQATQADVNEMVATLRQKLEEKPDNLTGWTMLGRSYMVMQKFEDAAYAYNKARALEPNNPSVLLPLADATAMMNRGQMAGEPKALIDQVLALEPENEMGLWLAGMAASQVGDEPKAIEYWSKLETLLPSGSEDRAEVRKMLASLGVALPESAVVEADPDAVIEVSVTLSETLSGQASADDFVFVYAKAVQGPPMPLAVERRQVKDLPFTVVLSDAQAMMPQLKLSGFDAVTVGARVSKTGQPVAASGDLFDEETPVALGAQVSLSIDKIKQ